MACTTVIDPPGAGGAAQSGDDDDASGAGAGKPNGSVTATIDAASTVATGAALCQSFCASTASCFLDCQAVCDGLQTGPCAAQGALLMDCLKDNFDSTTCQDQGCGSQIIELLNCRENTPPTCADQACVATEHGCVCSRQCADGEEKAICQTSGVDASCTCYFNSMPFSGVAGSSAPGVESCDVMTGSCSSHFAGGR